MSDISKARTVMRFTLARQRVITRCQIAKYGSDAHVIIYHSIWKRLLNPLANIIRVELV